MLTNMSALAALQEAGIGGPQKDNWMSFLQNLLESASDRKSSGLLLLAALQGGLMRSLAAWAQQSLKRGWQVGFRCT